MRNLCGIWEEMSNWVIKKKNAWESRSMHESEWPISEISGEEYCYFLNFHHIELKDPHIITAWKMSKYEVVSGPNTGKYGPETTP